MFNMGSKGKFLTAALVLALPLSACGGTQQSAEQVVEQNDLASAPTTQSATGTDQTNTTNNTRLTENLQGDYTVAATNLDVPWSIQFDGDTVYITQRGGGIVKIENGEQTVQEIETTKPLRVVGEAGLTGFLLDPDFANNQTAYIYHAYEENGEGFNRIAKIQLDGDVWKEQSELIEGIPGGRIHEGGRLAIGPDGMLYSTSGDANRRELAQDLSSFGGKVLRMTTDGEIPADNPIQDSYVYAYGLRNSQGIDWTSEGVMYASDHGPSGSPIPGTNEVDRTGLDEMNVIEAGANYGWPKIMGEETAEGMVTPVYVTDGEAIAPSGIAVTPDDTILVATLAGKSLKEYDPKANTMTDILTDVGRVRDVKVHDGKIYVITNNTSNGEPNPDDDRLLILN